jgi:hypothetical protein
LGGPGFRTGPRDDGAKIGRPAVFAPEPHILKARATPSRCAMAGISGKIVVDMA